MKTKMLKLVSLIVVCLFAISPAMAQRKGEKKTIFKVEMDCGNCVKKIEENIAWEKGVTDLKCDLKNKTVEVTYKTSKTDDQKLLAAFEKIGKPAAIVTEKPKTTCSSSCGDSTCGK